MVKRRKMSVSSYLKIYRQFDLILDFPLSLSVISTDFLYTIGYTIAMYIHRKWRYERFPIRKPHTLATLLHNVGTLIVSITTYGMLILNMYRAFVRYCVSCRTYIHESSCICYLMHLVLLHVNRLAIYIYRHQCHTLLESASPLEH